MHRHSQEQVAEAARRRLALLGRELDQAGLRRVEADPAAAAEEVAGDEGRGPLPEPAPVAPAGRHVREAPRGVRRLGVSLGGWVGDQVPATMRGRVALDPGPVVLVSVLVALAVAVAAVVVVRTGADSEAVGPRLSAPSATTSALAPVPATGSADPSASAAKAATGSVTVDVAGKVRRPGVATLPAGSRVVDALERAGGPRGRVDLSTLNLARVLVDGEQILVGRPAAAVPGGLAAGASTAAPDPVGALVNLNTATAEQLETLPGVGPVTAQKILEWRTAHGVFSAVDELLEVDGIGEKTLADLAPHVTV